MTIRVKRVPLSIATKQVINFPEDFKLLDVGVQHGCALMWVVVDDRDDCTDPVEVLMFANDEAIDLGSISGTTYVGSIQFHEGDLVRHVFVRGLEAGQ